MVNLAPIDFLLVEEDRWLNRHEHVHGDEDHSKKRKSHQYTNEGTRAKEFLNIHVIQFLVAIWRHSLHICCKSLDKEEREDKGVCGCSRSFHNISERIIIIINIKLSNKFT